MQVLKEHVRATKTATNWVTVVIERPHYIQQLEMLVELGLVIKTKEDLVTSWDWWDGRLFAFVSPHGLYLHGNSICLQ